MNRHAFCRYMSAIVLLCVLSGCGKKSEVHDTHVNIIKSDRKGTWRVVLKQVNGLLEVEGAKNLRLNVKKISEAEDEKKTLIKIVLMLDKDDARLFRETLNIICSTIRTGGNI